MKVSDPSGQTWRVSRRWLPWRRRHWDKDRLFLDDVPADGVDEPIVFVFLLALLVLALAAPIVLLALVVAAEFLLLLAFLPFAVLARVLFGKHWRVELRHGWHAWTELEGGDWQTSGLRVRDLAAAVERGEVPQRTLTPIRWWGKEKVA